MAGGSAVKSKTTGLGRRISPLSSPCSLVCLPRAPSSGHLPPCHRTCARREAAAGGYMEANRAGGLRIRRHRDRDIGLRVRGLERPLEQVT